MRNERIRLLTSLGVPKSAAETLARSEPDRQPGRIEFRAQEDGEAEILLYDFIGFDPFDDSGMSAKHFKAELDAARGRKLTVRINSPGGDVWDGMAIFNMLSDFAGETRVVIEGIAASAASLIAMAGDTIDAYATSQLMIHDAWTVVLGNEQELRAIADVLNRIDGQMADVYSRVSGRPASEWRKTMDSDSYLTAQEAKAEGLVHNVLNGASSKSRTKPGSRKSNAEKLAKVKADFLGIPTSDRDDTRGRVKKVSDNLAASRPINRNGEKWVSCLHEAGHAVSAVVRGEPIHEVGLSDDNGWVAAYCRIDSRKLSLQTLYAGQAADRKARGVCWERPGTTDVDDQNRIRFKLEQMCPYSGQDAEDKREHARETASNQAIKLVNRNWPKILAVAERLYRQGRLTGDEVQQMVNTREPAATK